MATVISKAVETVVPATRFETEVAGESLPDEG